MNSGRNFIWITLFAGILLITGCDKQQPVRQKQESLQQKFEPLYHSEKSIEGAIMNGVSYERYNELASGFATELLIAREKAASPEEEELVRVYFEVLTTYQDGLTDGKIYQDGTVVPLVQKYQLVTTKEMLGSREWTAIAPDSIQKIWAVAGTQAAKASLYYLKEGKN